MQIGTVAKKIGVSVDAIRFYERNALLPRPPRTQGGFRRYAESDVETLAFIRRVQGLGFKLSEIRGLLRLRGNRVQACAPVQRRLQEKLADVQRKLSDLHKLEHELPLRPELHRRPRSIRSDALLWSAKIPFLSRRGHSLQKNWNHRVRAPCASGNLLGSLWVSRSEQRAALDLARRRQQGRKLLWRIVLS